LRLYEKTALTILGQTIRGIDDEKCHIDSRY